MTNIGSLSGGSSGGITGQLDVQWIVEQIIYAKQQPIRDLETYEIFFEAKREAFQELNTKVSALESALYNLNKGGFETKSASLSREDYVSADASITADKGEYSLIVQQLASSQSDSSTGFASANDPLLTDDTFQIYQDAAKTILLGEVDYSGGTQSLTDLKDAINSLGLDVSATVIRYDTDDYRLQLTADDTGTDNAFYVTADADLAWSTKVTATDAQFYVNNPDDNTNYITRSSNTIDDVISGVTLNLLDADDTKTTTLTIGSDSSNLKENIQTFVTAYNETMDYLNAQFTFDEDRDAAGVLSGESAAVKVKTDLLTLATSRVGGHDGSNDYSSFAVIGLEINRIGQLEINDEALDEAIENNLDAVKRIFADTGTAGSSYLSFIGSSDDTQGGSYEVLITTVAEQALTQEGSQNIDTLTGDETLTITLNSSNYTVDLTTGMTSDDIVAAINSQKDADGYEIPVYAQVSAGKLRIYSDNYGSSQNISVKSDTAAAATGTTGIGTTALTGQGVDVAGTIGGDTASGSGRTLTGTAGDSKGLMVYVTATTVPAGNSLGDVYFTRGVAEGLRDRMYELSFPYSGLLANNIESFDNKLSNIADKVRSINLQLEAQQEILITQFTKANEALAQMTYLQSTLSNNFK